MSEPRPIDTLRNMERDPALNPWWRKQSGRAADEIERLRSALERIEVRGLEIISEHVGGSDASYVAQELTAIAREALNENP